MTNQSDIKREALKPCTYQMACEHIEKANILTHKDGSPYKATEIFNYSRSGELFMISEWYLMAVNKLGFQAV